MLADAAGLIPPARPPSLPPPVVVASQRIDKRALPLAEGSPEESAEGPLSGDVRGGCWTHQSAPWPLPQSQPLCAELVSDPAAPHCGLEQKRHGHRVSTHPPLALLPNHIDTIPKTEAQ